MCLCNTRSSVHSFLLLDFEHNLWGSRNTSGIATQPIVFPGGWSPQCISMFVLEQGDKLKEGLRYVWGPFVVCPLGLRLFKLSICKDYNTWTCFLGCDSNLSLALSNAFTSSADSQWCWRKSENSADKLSHKPTDKVTRCHQTTFPTIGQLASTRYSRLSKSASSQLSKHQRLAESLWLCISFGCNNCSRLLTIVTNCNKL